ncbi:septation protein SepH [Bifidobacterium cebidarum]|nr:septation protein SepH [Bifidobacterium cebidarum]
MPENRLEKAHFERVSDTGDLVFSVGDRHVAISLDDTLERAILEAKQVKSETQKSAQPHEQTTLPISQIQSLIRAGADPSRVAERYGLSETLVRRFSAAVETEKQYAIEQFLTVPAPKDSRVRTINELVERTLASASIGMESVTWKSTRRGLEPWRIVAIFTSAGREIHAEWTWNMHDNSVVCLNNAARKLLGERSAADDSKSAARVLPTPALPGDSVRSARIERAVSAWAAPEPSIPAAVPQAASAADSTKVSATDFSASGSMPPVRIPGAASAVSGATSAVSDSATGAGASTSPIGALNPLQPVVSTASHAAETSKPSSTAAEPADRSSTSSGDSATDTAASASHTTKPAKRRSGRSAVPSWDEILFGD